MAVTKRDQAFVVMVLTQLATEAAAGHDMPRLAETLAMITKVLKQPGGRA